MGIMRDCLLIQELGLMTGFLGAEASIAADDVIFLKRLAIDDVTERYVSWLNDPDVNAFLECRHSRHTLESTRDFVVAAGSPDSDQRLYGIYLRANTKHIGNIKLGPINSIHKHGTVGLLIGDPAEWGKGYGSRAIMLLTDYALNQLNLVSLNAGCYSENIGSYKSFLKAGWKLAGKLKSYWIDSKGNRTDELILTISKPQSIKLPDTGGITLIGGGVVMVAVAKNLRSLGHSVAVVLSPRHNQDSVREALTKLHCSTVITENINTDRQSMALLKQFSRICICFGPAWIFADEILEIYGGRIFNFNGIPIPDYLGGAHFTWQILNRSKKGGAYIQQISKSVDRGLVAEYVNFSLPEDCKTPLDYERFNHQKAISFLGDFIETHLVHGHPIDFSLQQPDWEEHTYFPRLSTISCAWIDWNWDGQQIEDFCNAFSDPYPGARSFINENVMIIKKAKFICGPYYHPYCYGLLINKFGKRVKIAVKGGILEAVIACNESEESKGGFSRGDRFVTPALKLEEARARIRYNSTGAVG